MFYKLEGGKRWEERETTHNVIRTDKSLASPGSKQATGTEDFEFHISYLQ
jgi:hypothetical protein